MIADFEPRPRFPTVQVGGCFIMRCTFKIIVHCDRRLAIKKRNEVGPTPGPGAGGEEPVAFEKFAFGRFCACVLEKRCVLYIIAS